MTTATERQPGVRVMVPWYDVFGNVSGWMTGVIAGPVEQQQWQAMTMYGMQAQLGGRIYKGDPGCPVDVLGTIHWRVTDHLRVIEDEQKWPRIHGTIRQLAA